MPATTTYTLTGDAHVDSLLGGVKWAVSDLTFSFPTSASFYGSGYGYGEPGSNFGALSAIQQSAARAAFGMVSSVTNLTFRQVTEGSTQQGDLRLALTDKVGTAWAYYPSTRAEGGDIWFNKSNGYYTSPQKGNYAFTTFLHEVGHALGLEHAHEGRPMPTARDTMEYTVMSYRSHAGASTSGGYTNEKWGYAQSLMMYDIAALQHMYGANFKTNAGNTIYSWSPTTGEMFINGIGQGAPGGNRIFLTVWDGGGVDTYDFSNYSTALKVDLRPGGWTTTSSAQLARLHYDGSKIAAGNIANALIHKGDTRSLIENAKGGTGNDVIAGNLAANTLWGNAGNDTLYGREGNDILIGGAGADVLDGGAGFDYASYADAKAGVTGRLDNSSLNTGDAAGDRYVSIEGLIGSAFNDLLVGNAGANRLLGGAGNDMLIGGAGADVLDGGAGFDYASYSTATAGVTARLDNPSLNTGDAAGDTYVGIEGLVGSAYNDLLVGDASANRLVGGGGNDTLMGGGGNDVLIGRAGADRLIGGAGSDVFVFERTSDSLSNARDRIEDFTRGVDKIDLRPIDADTKLAGDQAFTFIGAKAFTGKAGELNFAKGILSGDTNGDGIADFQIEVLNVSALSASDFYL
jgi:serralysin